MNLKVGDSVAYKSKRLSNEYDLGIVIDIIPDKNYCIKIEWNDVDCFSSETVENMTDALEFRQIYLDLLAK
jgi:hypothetical protein